jgi:hypothetical protein
MTAVGSLCSATRMAASQSWLCRYMSMASLGLPAVRQTFECSNYTYNRVMEKKKHQVQRQRQRDAVASRSVRQGVLAVHMHPVASH